MDKIDKILEKLDTQGNRLTKIETRLDSVDKNLGEHMKRTDQNEAEIKSLQKFRWMSLGVLAVVTLLIQLFAKKL